MQRIVKLLFAIKDMACCSRTGGCNMHSVSKLTLISLTQTFTCNLSKAEDGLKNQEGEKKIEHDCSATCLTRFNPHSYRTPRYFFKP